VLHLNLWMGPHSGKLHMWWLVPYQVTKMHGDGRFSLVSLDGVLLPKAVNGFKLKPYVVKIEVPQPCVGNISVTSLCSRSNLEDTCNKPILNHSDIGIS